MVKLQWKQKPWKTKLREGLEKAQVKLSQYYGDTYESLRHLYGVATLLDPSWKDNLFSTSSWTSEPEDWWAIYWEKLQERYERGYSSQTLVREQQYPQSLRSDVNDLDLLLWRQSKPVT